ncbi:thiol-disulfide oxidoreductase DCC family protein [Corynebacterium auris]|uniref:thiol-disulfide oxidoreductase DCC family protein n=1 Tax=Corynebacterium auris TaxID=44750 RepID=UPI0025B601B6|nr:DUF393 domain-containing protein [Corynebacterium auris]
MTAVDLVFDGQCGFCTRAVLAIKRLDRNGRVTVHPFQRDGVLDQFDLTPPDVQNAAWAISGTGRYGGAGSINIALDAALGISLFSRFYRLPGVRHAQDRVYGWVASRRYLFRGVTPWCSANADDCGAAVPGASCGINAQSTSGSCRLSASISWTITASVSTNRPHDGEERAWICSS